MTPKQIKITAISIVVTVAVCILILLGLNLMKYSMAFGAGAIVGAIAYHMALKKFSKKPEETTEVSKETVPNESLQ